MSQPTKRYLAVELIADFPDRPVGSKWQRVVLAAEVESVEAENKQLHNLVDKLISAGNVTVDELSKINDALAAKEALLVEAQSTTASYFALVKSRTEDRDTLQADLARGRGLLDEALITMRNYYGHAISRAAVEEFITKAQAILQPEQGEQ